MESRLYKVAKAVFEIRLEEPWRFMQYSDVVLERIRTASEGGIGLPVLPTRAGDKEPRRTLIQKREELLPGCDLKTSLDLSQYEPFRYQGVGKPDFTVTVKAGPAGCPALGEKLLSVDSQPPYYTIYEDAGAPRITLDENLESREPAATLCINPSFTEGEIYPSAKLQPQSLVFELSTALMMMFTYNQSSKDSLLVHASAVEYKGQANIFLGRSGTGKSTHSHLWLEHIAGAGLINDDNPVISFSDDGKPYVYGSPWSGKTPCYRNISVPVRAIVRLEQAPENSVTRNSGFEAYASFIGSVSSIRWNRGIMDGISSSAEKLVQQAKVFVLKCRPDRDAALTCLKAIEEESAD